MPFDSAPGSGSCSRLWRGRAVHWMCHKHSACLPKPGSSISGQRADKLKALTVLRTAAATTTKPEIHFSFQFLYFRKRFHSISSLPMWNYFVCSYSSHHFSALFCAEHWVFPVSNQQCNYITITYNYLIYVLHI